MDSGERESEGGESKGGGEEKGAKRRWARNRRIQEKDDVRAAEVRGLMLKRQEEIQSNMITVNIKYLHK